MSKEAEVKAAFGASFPERAPLHLLINNAARFVFGEARFVTPYTALASCASAYRARELAVIVLCSPQRG